MTTGNQNTNKWDIEKSKKIQQRYLSIRLNNLTNKSTEELILNLGGSEEDTNNKNYVSFFETLKEKIANSHITEHQLQELIETGNKIKRNEALDVIEVRLLKTLGLNNFTSIKREEHGNIYEAFEKEKTINIQILSLDELLSISQNHDAPGNMLHQIAEQTKNPDIVYNLINNSNTLQSTIDSVIYSKFKEIIFSETQRFKDNTNAWNSLGNKISIILFPELIGWCLEGNTSWFTNLLAKRIKNLDTSLLNLDTLNNIEAAAKERVLKEDNGFRNLLNCVGKQKMQMHTVMNTVTLQQFLLELAAKNTKNNILYLQYTEEENVFASSNIISIDQGRSKDPLERVYFTTEQLGNNKYGRHAINGTKIYMNGTVYILDDTKNQESENSL